MSVQPSTYPMGPQVFGSFKKKGNLGSRSVIPASHNQAEQTAGGLSWTALFLILGIIFWAVGASSGNLSMVTAGKILFALSFAPIIVGGLCLCCCICSRA